MDRHPALHSSRKHKYGLLIIDRYYILRDDMLRDLVKLVREQIQQEASWQVSASSIQAFATVSGGLTPSLECAGTTADTKDIEATLHLIRFSSEGVPLGEDQNLPILFSEEVLGRLTQRPTVGHGEERLRLTVVSLIRTSFPPRVPVTSTSECLLRSAKLIASLLTPWSNAFDLTYRGIRRMVPLPPHLHPVCPLVSRSIVDDHPGNLALGRRCPQGSVRYVQEELDGADVGVRRAVR
jgi:hypothetical protein